MTHPQSANEEELTHVIASLENTCTLKRQILALNVGASSSVCLCGNPSRERPLSSLCVEKWETRELHSLLISLSEMVLTINEGAKLAARWLKSPFDHLFHWITHMHLFRQSLPHFPSLECHLLLTSWRDFNHQGHEVSRLKCPGAGDLSGYRRAHLFCVYWAIGKDAFRASVL